MCSEESKGKKDEGSCCNHQHFQIMFEMMSTGNKDKGSFDCSSMMEGLKSRSCCVPEAEKGTSRFVTEAKNSCCV